jgi:DNA repair protein RadD
MVGRGTRLAEGKTDCLVLDFGGNAMRHGPLDQITGRVKTGTAPPPMKTCPECEAVILAAADECPQCGHDFEIVRERKKHDAQPLAAPMLSSEVSDWLPVSSITYHRRTKPGSPDSMRVDYHCGLTRYSEWICFEHGGYAAAKAARWWLGRIDAPVPTLTATALDRAGQLERPRAIRIRKDGQFWRVVQVRFS